MEYKIFFTTDIHGSERCFRKFINSAKFYEVQAIIMGGDITGKAIIPIIDQGNGKYKATLTAERIVAKEEVPDLEKEIRFNGYYPYVTSNDEIEEISKDPEGKTKLFRSAIRKSLEQWFELAEERLKPQGIQIFISPGNDDDFIVDEVLKETDYIINPEDRLVEIVPGIQMISYGYANPTPWNSPRELSEEEIGKHLFALADTMSYDKVTIFNTHVPPYNTSLDMAPKLDKTLKPIVEGGQVAMECCGSKAVRAAIEKYQPTLGLHGHVHESAGVFKLKKTICINPGSEYNDGILRGVIVNIKDKKKISYQLTMG